jgi:hypothetical protein
MPLPFDWETRTGEGMMTGKEKVTREEAQEIARTIQGFVDYAREQGQRVQSR